MNTRTQSLTEGYFYKKQPMQAYVEHFRFRVETQTIVDTRL